MQDDSNDKRPAGTSSSPAQSAHWKSVVVPAEHGAWGLLAEPLLLGLVLAPFSAGACLALAAVFAFLARQPLRLVLMDRRRGARHPRTALALRCALGFAASAGLLLAAASQLALGPIWPALVSALPFALVALGYDAAGRARQAVPEAAGAVACAAAAAAIALAGGLPAVIAFAAAALLALRGSISVLYIRARIRLDRGIPAAPGVVLIAHAAALVVAALLAREGAAPWLAPLAFGVLFARAALGLAPGRRPLRPQQLGFQEVGYGLLTLMLLAVGYLAPA